MKLTSQDVQRYVRIGLQWLAAYLTTKGMLDPNATWVQPVSGAIVAVATLAWTVYGNRIQAKIDEFLQVAEDKSISKDAKIAVTNAVAAMPETEKVVSTLGSDPATQPNVVTK